MQSLQKSSSHLFTFSTIIVHDEPSVLPVQTEKLEEVTVSPSLQNRFISTPVLSIVNEVITTSLPEKQQTIQSTENVIFQQNVEKSSIVPSIQSTENVIFKQNVEKSSIVPSTQSPHVTFVPFSSQLLLNASFADFSTTLSWDSLSSLYHDMTSGNTRIRKGRSNPVFMKMPYKWEYAEIFTYSPILHSVTFLRNDSQAYDYNKGSIISFFINSNS